ncbi:MAG: hypothetical protein ACR2PW_04500 [Gammaproteobacteria bacterium]
MAEKKGKEVDRWEYPDGTPTTKADRAYLDEHGQLPGNAPDQEESAEE